MNGGFGNGGFGNGDAGRDLCFAHVTHRYKFPDKIDLDALMSFRNIWIDAPLAKRKKQERLISVFWMCVRQGYNLPPLSCIPTKVR